jgi:hypothetical protein
MKKLVLACVVIACILVLGIAITEQGNFPTLTPTVTTSPSPSPTATLKPTPTATPTSKPTRIPSAVPYDFNISLDYGTDNISSALPNLLSYTLTKGCIICVATMHLITMSGDVKSVNPHDVLCSADSGSSGIQCVFNGTSYTYGYPAYVLFGESAYAFGFTINLTMYIPNSAPTNTYPITITAKIGSVSHSMSILVSVRNPTPTPTPTEILNPVITVSGTVSPDNPDITVSQLKFQNLNGGKLYFAALTEDDTYSIDLPNCSSYSVWTDNGTVPNGGVQWRRIEASFAVNVPGEITSMTKDFTVPLL